MCNEVGGQDDRRVLTKSRNEFSRANTRYGHKILACIWHSKQFKLATSLELLSQLLSQQGQTNVSTEQTEWMRQIFRTMSVSHNNLCGAGSQNRRENRAENRREIVSKIA